jgi:RNA polymerase primary sigma factor
VHVIELINKVLQASQELARRTGSRPSPEEIAGRMELPVEKVKKVLEIARRGYTLSLETPIGDEDSRLGDFIPDKDMASPEEATIQSNLAEKTQMILATLTPREEKIVRKRFGIGESKAYTLQELGEEFGVTRERVRQIEAKALRKLRRRGCNKTLGLVDS